MAKYRIRQRGEGRYTAEALIEIEPEVLPASLSLGLPFVGLLFGSCKPEPDIRWAFLNEWGGEETLRGIPLPESPFFHFETEEAARKAIEAHRPVTIWKGD